MLRSMTGFGAAACDDAGAHFAVEVRSLNNKYLKTTTRLADELTALEAEIEAAIARRLARGSVIVTVRMERSAATTTGAVVDRGAVARLANELVESIPASMRGHVTVDLATLCSVPGVLASEPAEAVVERARPVALRLVDQACDALIAMRLREGRELRAELDGHRTFIAERLGGIRERAPLVVDQYQERLRTRMQTMLDEVGATVRDEDMLREVAAWAERTDIAEECARLGGHLEHFAELIDESREEPVGRTLDFLAQEMLREANTIASKSADSDTSRLIVEIKGAIDRVKEQAANAE